MHRLTGAERRRCGGFQRCGRDRRETPARRGWRCRAVWTERAPRARAVRTIAHCMSLLCPHGHDPPVHARRPIRAARQLAGRRNRHCWITDRSWTDLRAATTVYPATDSYPWRAHAGHDAEPELGRPRAADTSLVSTLEACGRGVTGQTRRPRSCLVSGTRQQETASEGPESVSHTIFGGHERDPAAGHGHRRPRNRARLSTRQDLCRALAVEVRSCGSSSCRTACTTPSGLGAIGVAAAFASVVGATVPSTAFAGTLGGEPPDFPNPGPTFTAVAGTNTVDGALGPTPGDIQDAFTVNIPAGLHVTGVSYVGPLDPANNLIGCGLTGTSNLNQTFSPAQTNCQLSYLINDNFSTEPQPWTVTINTVDTTPPTLTVPANQTVEATGPTGATATFTATATDGGDPTPTVACVPTSGSTFPLGTTPVTCTATDDSGNTSSGVVRGHRRGHHRPRGDVPDDRTLEATGPRRASTTYTPTATDAVDGTPPRPAHRSPGAPSRSARTP